MSETTPGRKQRKPSLAKEAAASVVAAADFKARCLDLMDQVNETGIEYTITKHGKPVAKLVPCDAPKKKGIFGCMKGTVLKYDHPFDPVPGKWDVNR